MAKSSTYRFLIALLVLGLALTACTAEDEPTDDDTDATETEGETGAGTNGTETEETTDSAGERLAAVRDAGEVVCGVNAAVPGFGFQDEDGEFSGFDIDFCRAIAAAVLGDAEAVRLEPLTAEQRFTSLQSGEIDVLVRNTTWTAIRDGNEGAAFVTTTFYDGQGMMVRDGEFDSIDAMQNTDICVLSGTTTELNLESRFARDGIPYTAVPFENNDTLREAFLAGRCDGWTSDKSQLAGVRSAWPDEEGGPDALTILDETFSKEPLGPAVQDGDQEWFDAVNWAVIATIQAEEFGITSENIDEFLESEDPEIRRFLGLPGLEDEAVFDPGLGLDTDFAVNVIEQVGSYAEIYDRNVGPDSALGLDRLMNALWTDGGLLYPPPYR